jgi:hypothetical protein
LLSFDRARGLLHDYTHEKDVSQISPDTVDVFRLKERISQEIDKLFPSIYSKLTEQRLHINQKDISIPISEVQNRVNCIVQAM